MPRNLSVAQLLAMAFLAGSWDADAMARRAAQMLQTRRRWLHALAVRTCAAFADPRLRRRSRLAQFLAQEAGLARALNRDPSLGNTVDFKHIESGGAALAEQIHRDWSVRELHTPSAVAEWLDLSLGELDWFARVRRRSAPPASGKLAHYRYRWVAKRSGGQRLIEAPKPRLAAIQRCILHEILDWIPQHEAAHGCRPNRSIATCAAPHVGQHVVIRLDLRDFFVSIARPRVQALFLASGYNEASAAILAGLCTNGVPVEALSVEALAASYPERLAALERLRQPHLPQGAPTSPALANLCAFDLDCRLAGLARSADASYTRYCDDLFFSGGASLARSARRFVLAAHAIALDEGFQVHARKTRIFRRGVRQRVTCLVVNQRVNVRRGDYDALKATLHNCVRHGAASQNHAGHADYRARLLGQIAFVTMIHPERGAKLRAMFDRIAW